MKYRNRLLLASSHFIVSCADGAQTLVSERTLSVDAALENATAALSNCCPPGVPVAITVLDHDGRTNAVLCDDGTNLRAQSAQGAHRPSLEHTPKRIWKHAAVNPTSNVPLPLISISISAGGFAVRAGNTVVNAIGIS